MSHLFAPHVSPIMLANPSSASQLTPVQQPNTPGAGGQTGAPGTFLGSALIPPQPGAANQKKLLGQ